MPVPVHKRRTRKEDKDAQPRLHAQAILAKRTVKELESLEAPRLVPRTSAASHRVLGPCGGRDGRGGRRAPPSLVPSQARSYWASGVGGCLRELEAATAFVPRAPRQVAFLDIGCAPGGFSAYMLSTYEGARGVGIPLPEHQASGERLLFRPTDTRRYKHVHAGLHRPDVGPSPGAAAGYILPKAFRGPYPLVYMDAVPARASEDPGPHTRPGDDDTEPRQPPQPPQPPTTTTKMAPLALAHFVAQLLTALTAVERGGTIVMRLAHIERAPAAQIVYMLDMVSATLAVHAPSPSPSREEEEEGGAAAAGVFYAVAKGVGADAVVARPLQRRYVAGLRALWAELSGGEGARGAGRRVEHELARVVGAPRAILDGSGCGYLDRFVELARPVWAAQACGSLELKKRAGDVGRSGAPTVRCRSG